MIKSMNWLKDLTDFSNDQLGVKSVIFFIILLTIIIFFASLFSIDGGRGGNPQESYRDYSEDY